MTTARGLAIGRTEMVHDIEAREDTAGLSERGGGGSRGGGGAPRQEGWASKIPQSSYPDTCLSKGPE